MELAPWLAFIGIVNSGISVGYYALVLKYMYFANPPEVKAEESSRDPELYVLLVTGIMTVLLGLRLAGYIAALLT